MSALDQTSTEEEHSAKDMIRTVLHVFMNILVSKPLFAMYGSSTVAFL